MGMLEGWQTVFSVAFPSNDSTLSQHSKPLMSPLPHPFTFAAQDCCFPLHLWPQHSAFLSSADDCNKTSTNYSSLRSLLLNVVEQVNRWKLLGNMEWQSATYKFCFIWTPQLKPTHLPLLLCRSLFILPRTPKTAELSVFLLKLSSGFPCGGSVSSETFHPTGRHAEIFSMKFSIHCSQIIQGQN